MVKKSISVIRCIFLVCLILLSLILLSHNKISRNYVFSNSIEDVVSIELLYNQNSGGEGIDSSNIHSIRLLTTEEIHPFMEEIYRLETRTANPPPSGWGCYLAKVTYSNGDVEMLGSYNIEYILAGHVPTGIGTYFFTGDAFEKLFSSYIDTTQYPYIGIT